MMHDHNNTVAPDATTSPGFTDPNRSAWQVIEEVCAQRLSGELALVTAAPTATRVYMNNGLVYFAEQDGDDTLAARLVISGALDDEQLRRGAIRLNGVEHLGRLFERDDTIDRDAVELAIELITEMALSDVADQPVRTFRTSMYRHHSSGINRWFSSQHTIEDEPVTGVPVITPSAPSQAAPPQAAPVMAAEIEPIVAALEAVVPAWVPVPVPVEMDEVSSFELEPEPVLAPVSVEEPAFFVDPVTFEEPELMVEPEPFVEPEIVPLAPVSPPKAEPYRAALDLSDLVAAMGVGTGRSTNPADDDRPVVKARMWAPSITPPEPVEPPPAVPEPFDRQTDPELESLIASLVPTAPAAPVHALSPLAPSPDRVEHLNSAQAAHDDDDGVEWFAMPATSAADVTAPIDRFDAEPAVAIEPESQPGSEPEFEPESESEFEPESEFVPVTAPIDHFEADPAVAIEPEPELRSDPEPEPEPALATAPSPAPELTVQALMLPTLPQFTRPVPARAADAPVEAFGPIHHVEPVHTLEPMTIESLGALMPIAPIPVSVTPAPMVPVPPFAPLATVHPIRDISPAATVEVPPAAPPIAYFIPELGSMPVPEDVAAAVRRAISAIEAATTSTGPLPVTFGPLHVTSFAQQPVFSPILEPVVVPNAPAIQPAHSDNGDVVPLMSLNGHATAAPEPTVAPITPSGIPPSAATMPFPEIDFPELPPAEELLNNPQPAPISNQRRGALRRLIDGIRRR